MAQFQLLVVQLCLLCLTTTFAATELVTVNANVTSEAERLAWIASDPQLTGLSCHECDPAYPKMLGQYSQVNLTLQSWMNWQYPDTVFRNERLQSSSGSAPCAPGIALWVGQTHEANQPWGVRSENQVCVPGYDQVQFDRVTNGCTVADQANAQHTPVLSASTFLCGNQARPQTCAEWDEHHYLDDGQSMTFRCHTGFSLDGLVPDADNPLLNTQFTRSCSLGSLGQVTASVGGTQCQAVSCGTLKHDPSFSLNGLDAAHEFVFGESAQIVCNAGYSLDRQPHNSTFNTVSSVQCQADGQFSVQADSLCKGGSTTADAMQNLCNSPGFVSWCQQRPGF